MFSDTKKSKQQDSSSIQNIIATGTKVVGSLTSEGDIRIDGIIEGDVEASGKVVVGKSGEIHGSLKSANAYFEGKFTGKLNLSGTLTLKPSAHIEGDVSIEKLAVEPGATFNVTCVMKSTVKDLKGERKSKKTA